MKKKAKEEKPSAGRFCSFCGKTEHEVKKLIAGPTVFICDDCISLCVRIIQNADGKFFARLRHELREDKLTRRNIMRIIDGTDEFWELMDEADILEHMAESILRTDKDLTDQYYERAYSLTKRAIIATRSAWKIITDAHPDLADTQMNASRGDRKIRITE